MLSIKMHNSTISTLNDAKNTQNFIFILVDNFSLIAFASAIEPLRLANRMSEKTLYKWTVCSPLGRDETKCSNGTIVKTSKILPNVDRGDTIIICGGTSISENSSTALLGWLRREARKGVGIGGVCTGAYVLAKAGLLSNRKCTIHWENRESFLEEFPNLELSNHVFTIDKGRYCAAG